MARSDFQTTCPTCGKSFGYIGNHWAASPDHRPDPKDRQWQILTGWLLGDAGLKRVSKRGKLPKVCCYNTNRAFLDWTQDELGPLAKSITVKRDADDTWKRSYQMYSVGHPEFSRYAAWYGDDGKKVPRDIDLTPLTIAIWYAGDGTVEWIREQYPRARITANGQRDRIDSLAAAIDDTLGIRPKTYTGTYNGYDKAVLVFSITQTREFIDALPAPPAGMAYKWAIDDYDRYDTLTEKVPTRRPDERGPKR